MTRGQFRYSSEAGAALGMPGVAPYISLGLGYRRNSTDFSHPENYATFDNYCEPEPAPEPDLQPFFQALTEGTTALGKEATFSQESFDAFWGKFYKQDTQFIRPSGNPLDRAGFCGMFASDDITDSRAN